MGYAGDEPREYKVVLAGNEPSYYQTYGAPRKGMLSREEKQNLTIAILVLTLCLTMAMFFGARGMLTALQESPEIVGFIALVAFFSTASGFFLHEMAHKFVAQRYGCWAEFRYSRQGLLIALIISGLVGFLYAAPGAVFIAGRIDERQNGIISIAGPLTNVAVALALLPVVLLFDVPLSWAAYTVVYFNSFLAIFNMIPVMPLDGAKVLKWNPAVYILTAVAMGALLFYVWIYLGQYIYNAI